MVFEQDKQAGAPKDAATIEPMFPRNDRQARQLRRPQSVAEALRLDSKAEQQFFEDYQLARGEVVESLSFSDKIFLITAFSISGLIAILGGWKLIQLIVS